MAMIESAGNSSNSTYEVQNEVQLMSSIVLAQKNKSSKDFNYTKMAMEGLCSTMRDMLANLFSCMEARSCLL